MTRAHLPMAVAFSWVVATPLLAVEQEAHERWVQANQAHDSGNYAAALDAYRALLADGYASSPLYYNVGNAELRSHHLGAAIAAYRHSLSLDPRNADARANLESARKRTHDALVPPGPSATARSLLFWHYALSGRELLAASLGTYVTFWLALLWRRLRAGSELAGWIAVTSLVALLLLGGSLLVRHVAPEGLVVVVSPSASAHTGTRADSSVRFVLHEGAEVRLLEHEGDWARVALPDGQQGWIAMGELVAAK
ncbi:MAG: hypothetical protein AAB426_00145 [Myxococcota bacterium]